jgi:hypothetical protein
MAETKKSKITEEHREEAAALKALWDDGRPRRTQTEFGEAYGLGNQANIGHYLLARNPLNLRAALSFAKELKCKVSEFSPRVATEIEQLLPLLTDQLPHSLQTDQERQLVHLFRELSPASKGLALGIVLGVHEKERSENKEEVPAPKIPPVSDLDDAKPVAPQASTHKATKRAPRKTKEPQSQ